MTNILKVFILCWREVFFFTHSWPRLETEAWSCETSLESRNISGRTVFGLLTWTELLPQNTWVAQARSDLTEKAFATELNKRRKQSGNNNNRFQMHPHLCSKKKYLIKCKD